jgi:hypothetical protein
VLTAWVVRTQEPGLVLINHLDFSIVLSIASREHSSWTWVWLFSPSGFSRRAVSNHWSFIFASGFRWACRHRGKISRSRASSSSWGLPVRRIGRFLLAARRLVRFPSSRSRGDRPQSVFSPQSPVQLLVLRSACTQDRSAIDLDARSFDLLASRRLRCVWDRVSRQLLLSRFGLKCAVLPVGSQTPLIFGCRSVFNECEDCCSLNSRVIGLKCSRFLGFYCSFTMVFWTRL